MVDKIEQVVRLIRSKGVGVYFVTQNPLDLPESVLGQLGNRIQHALRAFTPRDQKAVKSAAETFRANPGVNVVEAITTLGVGEALISILDEKGMPTPVEIAMVYPPKSQLAPLSNEERNALVKQDDLYAYYSQYVDNESAFEVLNGQQQVATAEKVEEEDEGEPVNLAKSIAMIVFGLLAVVLGSDLVVRGASDIAANFGVSQRLISLTIVALGTSLPELVTSVIATKKGEYDIAIGNIVGSNIFNIGIVAGLPVAILGGVAGGAFSIVDVVALVISPIVLFIFAKNDQKISFKEAGRQYRCDTGRVSVFNGQIPYLPSSFFTGDFILLRFYGTGDEVP